MRWLGRRAASARTPGTAGDAWHRECRRRPGRQPALHGIVRDTAPVLHVTNGDSAVGALRAAGIEGDVLPWRDALHEGPVRAGLDPAALRAERARFIAERGWAEEAARARRHDRARRAPRPRDRAPARRSSCGSRAISTTSSSSPRSPTAYRPAQRGSSSSASTSSAAWRSSAGEEIRAAEPAPFDPAPYAALWRAFTAPDPRGLDDLDAPPVVRDAARRHLQQFPWTTDGLNRSERAVQRRARPARARPGGVRRRQRQEERPFLGDAIAFEYLDGSPRSPARERWLGGVHLPAGRRRGATTRRRHRRARLGPLEGEHPPHQLGARRAWRAAR